MQVLAETEYQDLYRVKDGVLLVVNKFVPIKYEDNEYFRVWKAKQGKYNKGCQDWLKVLKETYHDKYSSIVVPKGTVTYMDTPVIPIRNKSDFKYQIKTTGDLFSGNADEMEKMLNEILSRITNETYDAEWIYWDGWNGNHDRRIDDATCSKCGWRHPVVQGSPEKLSDFCAGCGSKMKKNK